MSKALATKKVAAVLLGFGMVLAFASTASAQTTSSTLSTLQAQVQALLAQIAALQGSGTATGSGGACFTFTLTEQFGSNGGQVMWVQEFLNGHGFTVAASGAGSPGNETAHFGALTRAAVAAFQKANGISPTAGYWGPLTRAKANAICAGSTTTTTTTTTPGAGVTVTAGVQPANSLAPMNATRVPFTTFTLTNNSGAAVTINGVTVQRTGLANDNAFAGVILLDSNGLQYGNSQTFNSNHQATVGGTFTLQAGQSMTFTVAGNMELSPGNSDGGQVASISVVGINTSVPVTGSLPITGAQQTINETLSIGKATVSLSGFDPNSHRSEPIGTTGLIFSGVRITAGSAEDEKLYSITWNQTGSAGSTDLANLSTVVNGTSYPVTVDASGKYYTSTFPGGILVTKGNSVDVYIKGDITGSSASGRTVEFDIYRSSDIYLVGQTFGYGIAPTTSLSGTNTSGANTSSGGSNTANPFYFGTYVSVTGGTLSTVSSASTVAPQNIGVNVPNQVLGGFSTNFTGEPVTVQSVQVDTATTTGALGLTNVTLVDSNGNVVAGPVDATYVSGGVGKILFNSSITFPVGPITYTIKGTVTSGSTNGSTYTLSTNPNTEWLSPVGQTSGTYVTLPATTITMSTMTVQPGQLTISAASSPASTNVTINQNNTTIANIVLDASQSGEDVRLNSLPIIVSATSTYGATILQTNLTNCQLY
ncbi:MAG TPA: peptidoglycan-binding domain-containing protein, partial [Candidatus Paceibacterota bacterium]|nr:peptidoglycan-binding domain-containing protein [Candidatus Paceibacterota bacterium]